MKNNIFGINLQQARKTKHGGTQKEFAKTLGLSPSTYGQYENGKREPKYDLLLKIADTLEVSIDQLLRPDAGLLYKKSSREVKLSDEVKTYIQEEIQRTLKKLVSMI